MTGKLLLLAIVSVLLTGGMVVGSAAADDASPPSRGAAVGTSAGVGSTPSAAAIAAVPAAVDYDCSDFSNQASAQAVFLAAGGPASDPYRLDADHNGIACESLPCPCSTITTPTFGPTPTITPTPTPTAGPVAREVVLLKAKPKHGQAGRRATFKVTRLVDTGGGLVPTTGQISLEQRVHGAWQTIKGSKKTAQDGYATLKYLITGHLKVRAKGKGPETYSKVVKLRFQ